MSAFSKIAIMVITSFPLMGLFMMGIYSLMLLLRINAEFE